jgi:hypothetical protein
MTKNNEPSTPKQTKPADLTVSFDDNQMLSDLEDRYNFSCIINQKIHLRGRINGVKVDLITHNYPLVKPLLCLMMCE